MLLSVSLSQGLFKTSAADRRNQCSGKVIFTSGRNGRYLTHLERQEAHQMLADGTIRDGMIPKVKAALRAAKRVPHVQIIPGAEAHGVLRACFGDQPFGTTIVLEGRSDTSTSHDTLSLSVRDNHPGEAKGEKCL